MTAQVREIDVAALGPLVRIAGGGQGLVYRLRDTPDGPVYKEYLPRVVDDLDVDALRAFVRYTEELDAADREALLERVAWPEAVVRRDGVVRGFLMRQVPPRFRVDLTFGGTPSSELATAQFLLNPPGYLEKVGLAVGQRFRVEFLADTAEALALLHRLDIAVGDLSPNNLLFSQDARPRCFFVDSDSMRLGEHSVLPQGETPDWRVGDVGDEELGTSASDVYKFGLLAVRLFAGEQHTTDPAAAPVRLRRSLRRCLATDPAGRPGAADLADPLARTLNTLREPAPSPEPEPEPAPEPEPERVPRQRTPIPPVPAGRSLGGSVGWVVGALVLIGVVVGNVFDDSGPSSGPLTGGITVPATGFTLPDYPYPTYGLPDPTYYNPYPDVLPDLVPSAMVPLPRLSCLTETGAGVQGGEGLGSARVAIGQLCGPALGDWPALAEHAPYDGARVVGFFGEGTGSPSATVDLTAEDGRCWRTSVGFDAGYRVRSVGPLSPCG